jgi:hypothetical protein
MLTGLSITMGVSSPDSDCELEDASFVEFSEAEESVDELTSDWLFCDEPLDLIEELPDDPLEFPLF